MQPQTRFLGVNMIFPLLFGTSIYLLFRPEARVSSLLYAAIKSQPSMEIYSNNNILLRFLSCHACDMLWIYAFVFAAVFVLGYSKKNLRLSLFVSVATGAVLEQFQSWEIMSGTGDLLDIVLEAVAGYIASINIQNYFERKGYK